MMPGSSDNIRTIHAILVCLVLLLIPPAAEASGGLGRGGELHPVLQVPVSPRSDLDLLSDAACTHCGHMHEKPSVLLGGDSHWLVRYNPVSLAFSGMMYVYQRFISPQLPSDCLYEHSCSNFSKELIATYGLSRGMVFTADRLTRCNRVAAIDIHPLRISEATLRVREDVDIYKIKGK